MNTSEERARQDRNHREHHRATLGLRPQKYQLQSSESLATGTWQNLGDVVTGDGNDLVISTPYLPGTPRFYRLALDAESTGLVLIPAGNFTMVDSITGYGGEQPHRVYVSAFYMDKYETTKGLWGNVYQWAMNHGYSFDFSNSGQGKAVDHPVCNVTWYDAVKWCNARSEKEGRVSAYYTDAAMASVYRSGQTNLQNGWVMWNAGYRLPTEAEWEKAARGGSTGHRFPWTDMDTIQHSRANYESSEEFDYDTSPTRGRHPTFATAGEPYTSPAGYFAGTVTAFAT